MLTREELQKIADQQRVFNVERGTLPPELQTAFNTVFQKNAAVVVDSAWDTESYRILVDTTNCENSVSSATMISAMNQTLLREMIPANISFLQKTEFILDCNTAGCP